MGTGRGGDALILPFPLGCGEVARGIPLGPSAILAAGLGPALLCLTGRRRRLLLDPCGSRALQRCHQRGGHSLGPQRCAEPGKGNGIEKQTLALLPPQPARLRGCQGLHGTEKKDGVHGSCAAPSCRAGSQARQHLMGSSRTRFSLLAFSS